ncbi:hypothetical protein KC963_01225 [Candidatus Saccharibacteria bacterium]|nr:hypothetical protein [Candidatus Saccharibacteria bacterium]
MQKSGVVSVVNGPNKGGYYAIKIEGENDWYGIPDKTTAGIEKGDNITFSADKDNRGYWKLDPNSVAKVPANAGVSGGVQGRESYWQEKALVDVANHREIRWRSAVNSAINILELADKMDANPIPKTGGTKAKRYDLVLNLVAETALGIYASFESAQAEEEYQKFAPITRLQNDEFDDMSEGFADTPDTE